MKTVVLALLAIALAFVPATAQNLTTTTTSINLATDAGTTLYSNNGSGQIYGVACRVTTAVTGSGAWGISINVDGAGYRSLPAAYFFGNTWATVGGFGSGTGSAVGDHFVLPLGPSFAYSSSISVLTVPFSNHSAGALSCSVLR